MWSDRETEHDFLGYQSYVSVLAEVCMHKDLAPLTLGIFGSWGSGKSSLMSMLKLEIEGSAHASKTKTLWFNAWRYEGREEAQSALIHAVLSKLAEDKTLFQDAKDIFDRLKKGASILKLGKHITKSLMTLTPDIAGFIDCFREESEKIAETMEHFDKDFKQLLQRANIERIVVFIDDLDRCSSQKVIETFETIKLFLNTPECTFVIGADPDKIEESVGEIYKVTETKRKKDYLEKIIQIPFNIPEQTLQDIGCYVGMLIVDKNLKSDGRKDLIKARSCFYDPEGSLENGFQKWIEENRIHLEGEEKLIAAELKDVLPYVHILARGLSGNPRQIKRFLNILALRRNLAASNKLEVSPDLLIKIAVLEYVWEDFFNNVVQTVDPKTGHSELIAELINAAEKGLDSDSKLVSDSLQQPGLIQFLLSDPRITGDVNLNPYLFLAQTSLSRGRLPTLQPADQKARTLASSIESDDRLVSKTAAKQAAAHEPGVAASVVRILVSHLSQTKEIPLLTRILQGLNEICLAHPDQYGPVIQAISKVDPMGNEAVAITAGGILQAAEKAGLKVLEEEKNRFLKTSRLTEALTAPLKRGSNRRK